MNHVSTLAKLTFGLPLKWELPGHERLDFNKLEALSEAIVFEVEWETGDKILSKIIEKEFEGQK